MTRVPGAIPAIYLARALPSAPRFGQQHGAPLARCRAVVPNARTERRCVGLSEVVRLCTRLMHVPSVSALPGVPPPQLPRSRTRRRCAALCAKAATVFSTWLPSAGAVSPPLYQGRARTSRVVTLFQPTPRGGALVASAGEAGVVSEGRVQAGAFFNRTAELEVLTTLLAGAPTAVLLMTGPPSCGKSGAAARGRDACTPCARPALLLSLRVVTRSCSLQRCSSDLLRT